MTDVLVRAENLARAFGTGEATVDAVRGANFEIRAGDSIALVGPSGSGKSTLLHLAAGLIEPTLGAISWPALGEPGALRPRLVGFSFQGPSLLPALSVVENVAVPALLVGTDEWQATSDARELVGALGLSDVADKLPEDLSGGQAQRTVVARALINLPRLVLMDEPTGQQDRESAQHVIDRVLSIARDHGVALLLATHDTDVAARLATRWSMADGALMAGAAR